MVWISALCSCGCLGSVPAENNVGAGEFFSFSLDSVAYMVWEVVEKTDEVEWPLLPILETLPQQHPINGLSITRVAFAGAIAQKTVDDEELVLEPSAN